MSAEWTVMVYMAGNNSLSDAAGVDLEEMRQVGSTDAVKACAFIKQTGGGGAQRLVVGKGGEGETVEELGDIDSGDPQTVVDFVRWASEQAPAERRALVLWNHGGGWRPGDLDQVYAEVRGADGSRDRRSEINHRAAQRLSRVIFLSAVRKIAALPTREEREICSDDGTGHSLDTIELGRVCKLLEDELGGPLELLGMDACLMSNLEVAYEVRDHAINIVGSEELEPGAGWPYQTILADLVKEPSMDGATLGRAVVDRYIESYRDQESQWPVTQCAVATAEVEPLAEALDQLAGALRGELAQGWPQLMTAHANASRFEFELVDLATLCAGLARSSLSPEVKAAAEAVAAAVEPGGFVLGEGHLGDTVEGCKGISVYLPTPSEPVSEYYKDLAFAKRHKWDELLGAFSQAVRGGG